MSESLADYLDRLIYSLYGAGQRGVGYVRKSPLHSDVIEYLEDEETGRPCPLDDSADQYLIRQCDMLRRDASWDRVPVSTGVFGERRLRHRRWSGGYIGPGWVTAVVDPDGKTRGQLVQGHNYANEMSGIIPWRSMHDDPNWPCQCGHLPSQHHDDDDGGPVTSKTMFSYCDGEGCHCGMWGR